MNFLPQFLNHRHLFIFFIDPDKKCGWREDDHKLCIRDIIRDGHNQFKPCLNPFWHRVNGCEELCKYKMSKCGWRVICKNEVRWGALISDFENHSPDSKE